MTIDTNMSQLHTLSQLYVSLHTPVQCLYISYSEPDISSYQELSSLHRPALYPPAAHCLPGPAPPEEKHIMVSVLI